MVAVGQELVRVGGLSAGAVRNVALGLPGGLTMAAMCPLVDSTNLTGPPSSCVVR